MGGPDARLSGEEKNTGAAATDLQEDAGSAIRGDNLVTNGAESSGIGRLPCTHRHSDRRASTATRPRSKSVVHMEFRSVVRRLVRHRAGVADRLCDVACQK